MPITRDLVVRGEDWYGRELGAGDAYAGCTFYDLDWTEGASEGALFDGCTFSGVRFNASRHSGTAFTNCTFRKCVLFDARFEGCKVVGSRFVESTFGLLVVGGGDWSYAGLARADLRKAELDGVRLREADLTGARLDDATVTRCDLSAASLRGAHLTRADLRGSDLTSLDPPHSGGPGRQDRPTTGRRAGDVAGLRGELSRVGPTRRCQLCTARGRRTCGPGPRGVSSGDARAAPYERTRRTNGGSDMARISTAATGTSAAA
ncbi:pentapeptide repeat-containing protein, partial [Streptomyces sp. TRM64462]|uniref:pentapeptide repeat-containing protein n=1 Tax=Streptomyces sp. TRM64462 TaxID=2741726 RepID=UPI0020C79CA9